MIEVDGVTKRYGDKVAVRNLSFEVRPGIVTGFLGPHELTPMAVLLASPDSAGITGQVISVDGGYKV